MKTIDADEIVKDELDEADQENMIFAEDRLLHSSFKWIIELSQPSKPDYGINRSFKRSDQRYRMVKCPACGRWEQHRRELPANLMHKGKDDKLTAWIGCTRCRRKLDMRSAAWVAKHPSRSKEHVGFLHSQLYSNTVDTAFIYNRYTSAVSPRRRRISGYR